MEMASGVCGVRRGVRANRQTEEDSCFMSVRSADVQSTMSNRKCPAGLFCCNVCHHRLRWCGLSESHFQCVTSALKSNTSSLIQLDLSGNTLDGSELKLLCAGLKSPNCKLDALRSVHCLQLLVTIRLQGSCLFFLHLKSVSTLCSNVQ